MSRTKRWLAAALIGLGLAAALAAYELAQTSSGAKPATMPQPTEAQLAAAHLAKLPVASVSDRVDVTAPAFSNPTAVTNPLFPIRDLRSAVLSGVVDGKPFHTETTLLPDTRIIEWTEGKPVETLVSQYVAFLGGRIEEVALDYYAQANDGSVWYFGEDVFNYAEDGSIAGTDGTWLAGKDGPPAMIMPGRPHVGESFRPENIPGLVFEEVTVTTVDRTVAGPLGPVEGALVGRELHDDGTFSDKVFAPGYGEFYSAHAGDVEALALAVPTNGAGGSVPQSLEHLSSAADAAFSSVRSGSWQSASAAAQRARASWASYGQGAVPVRLAPEMERALEGLVAAIARRDERVAGTAAIDVAQSALDLKLRYLTPAVIDRARFATWARQVAVDAAAGDLGGVRGDVAALEWIRDRFKDTVEPTALTRIDSHLMALRDAVVEEDLGAAAAEAKELSGR